MASKHQRVVDLGPSPPSARVQAAREGLDPGSLSVLFRLFRLHCTRSEGKGDLLGKAQGSEACSGQSQGLCGAPSDLEGLAEG